jgi:RNA polymerase sigma-70 factor (ECF subfamily)
MTVPAAASTTSLDLARVVREHQAALWRHLRVCGASGSLATELVQETFVAWWRSRPVDLGPAALRGWLRATARNLFLADCRARRRRAAVETLDAEAVERAWANYERRDDGAGYRDALRLCLDTVPARERDLLAAAVVDGVGLDVLATQRGLGVEATRSLLRRLKAALRTCVRRRLDDGR